MQLVRIYYSDNLTVDQMEKALTCRRCEGSGKDRTSGKLCPNCGGDGDSRDNGWTYLVPEEWDVRVGSLIRVPPTPRKESSQVVTVIGLDSTFKIKKQLKEATELVRR